MPNIVNKMSSYCPIVEEFHIRNVLGSRAKKSWMFGSKVTLGSTADAVTLDTLSNGVITKLRTYYVMAQKMNAAPTNKTFITAKGDSGFTLNGDNAGVYSVLVLGSENDSYQVSPVFEPRDTGEYVGKITGRWAKDYCPSCKANNFWGLCGSIIRDEALFGFCHLLVGTTDTITFSNYRVHLGQGQQIPLTQMEDDDYLIFIGPSPGNSGNPDYPYPSSITEIGFVLNGLDASTYDVMIFGKVRY